MKSLLLARVARDLDFVILYGSQLGQAKGIAEGLSDAASEHSLKTKIFSLNEITKVAELRDFSCPVVIVTSTTGDGNPPENADKFFKKLSSKTLNAKTLHSVRYAILGLGDTNFNNFCNCGKTIHKRFQNLGAILFYPPAWADEAVGSERTIESWIEGIWPAIKISMGIGEIDPFYSGDRIVKLHPSVLGGGKVCEAMNSRPSTLTLPSCPQPTIDLKYHPEEKPPKFDVLSPPAPYPSIDGELHIARLSNARILTKPGSVKTTVEVTLSLGFKIQFEPGDAIAIVCPNPSSEVDLLLERLNLKHKQHETVHLDFLGGAKGKFPVHLPRKSTLSDLFMYFLDIRSAPKKVFLRILAESTEKEDERQSLLELSSREGGPKFEELIRLPSISLLDLLLGYPSCHPRVESLIEHLPRLIPRPYSIASSPLTSNKSFAIAFNVIVVSETDGRKYARLGLCTGWLYQLSKNLGFLSEKKEEQDAVGAIVESLNKISVSSSLADVVFYKRKNHSFRLPADPKAPVVMVGPGTGVAPFIGFIKHREHQKQNGEEVGPMVLYFGCRNKENDYIYKNELHNACGQNGVLTQLYVTFSREPDQNGLKYVQDFMEKNKGEVASDLLEKFGYLYVCGDAKNMAKKVKEKLNSIFQDVMGLTEKEAAEKVEELASSKRYLQDIWA